MKSVGWSVGECMLSLRFAQLLVFYLVLDTDDAIEYPTYGTREKIVVKQQQQRWRWTKRQPNAMKNEENQKEEEEARSQAAEIMGYAFRWVKL